VSCYSIDGAAPPDAKPLSSRECPRVTGRTIALAFFFLPLAFAASAVAGDEPLPALPDKARAQVFAAPGEVNVLEVSWLAWRFGGKAQRADWASLSLWVEARKTTQTAAMKLRMEALAEPGLDVAGMEAKCYDDLVCAQLESLLTASAQFPTRAKLLTAIKEAAPYYRAFSVAIDMAMREAPVYVGRDAPVSGKIAARRFRDQMWAKLGLAELALSPAATSSLPAQIQATFRRISFDNQNFLANEVLANGWPPTSTIGKPSGDDVWLMVQHCDQAPDFQLKSLQAMRPLLDKGEVSRSNYAYLYDRVRVNAGQKQRYGSQFTCVDGKWAPKPLEDPDNVDALRKDMDLEPLADYAKKFTWACK
jgi:hypothetical protein